MLMKTYVNDLLDIRQLKEGHFVLEQAILDPNETFYFVCEMLELQARAKGVYLSWQVADSLTI